MKSLLLVFIVKNFVKLICIKSVKIIFFYHFRMVGFFDVREPVYFVRDIDILRQMTIKDFDNFEDHVAFIESDSDALFGKSLFMLSEKKWRQMRATLSPAFTSSKMRHMFELVVECAEDMAKHLIDESKQGRSVRWEMKEFFSRYTSDVIGKILKHNNKNLNCLLNESLFFSFIFSIVCIRIESKLTSRSNK